MRYTQAGLLTQTFKRTSPSSRNKHPSDIAERHSANTATALCGILTRLPFSPTTIGRAPVYQLYSLVILIISGCMQNVKRKQKRCAPSPSTAVRALIGDDIIVQRSERRKDNSQKASGPHFGQQNLSLLSQYLTPNRDAWPIAVDGIVMDRQKVIDIIDRKVVSIDNIGCGQVHLRIKIDRKNMCPSFREGIGQILTGGCFPTTPFRLATAMILCPLIFASP